MSARPLLLAGERRETPARQEIRAPWDGRVVAEVCLAGPAEADEAAARAAEAFPALERSTTDERRRTLEAVSRLLREREELFAAAICDEAGKPIALARAEVQRAAETFHLAAGEAERLGGEILPVDLSPATAGYRCLVRRVPRGPALAIGPFNFPLNLLAHKIAPSLAVGAPVVVKPPPQAPTAALLLGELLYEVAPPGWPRGFVSVLPCANDVAERLVRDERFAVLSFTGSAEVGWKIKAIAGRKHVVLELGGDAAVIVCADADLELAARRVAWGALAYAGQVCISVQRVFAEESVRRDFADALAAAVRAARSGPPRDAAVLLGPVIDDRAAERIEQAVETSGGTVRVCGPRTGRLVAPTLVEDASPASALAREEVFGPVVGLWESAGFEEALEAVNRSPYGLQAGLYTRDLKKVFAAHDRLRVGGLVVNDVPTLRVDNYPYGGTKASGLGREGGRSGILEYTEPRVLLVNPG